MDLGGGGGNEHLKGLSDKLSNKLHFILKSCKPIKALC